MASGFLDPSGMSRVVGGKRYSVNSATLLADNEYWDGSNWQRGGRNAFLYKTRGGAFFRVDMTAWQGERDMLEPISRDDAMALYERLPVHYVSYENAFDTVVEEASAPGRPPLYPGDELVRVSIMLAGAQIKWLKEQPEGMAEKVRALIDQARAQ